MTANMTMQCCEIFRYFPLQLLETMAGAVQVLVYLRQLGGGRVPRMVQVLRALACVYVRTYVRFYV